MIIKSKFNDYYDACAGYGIDKAVVFERIQIDVSKLNARKGHSPLDDTKLAIEKSYYDLMETGSAIAGQRYRRFVVGFCGKLYVGLSKADLNGAPINVHNAEIIPGAVLSYIWHPSEVEAELDVVHQSLLSNKSKARTLREWFKRNEDQRVVDCPDLFFSHSLTSFMVMEPHRSIINPRLTDFGFQRMVDGVTAFQAVSMHVASLKANSAKQPEPISDDLKALSKGFDARSFRHR